MTQERYERRHDCDACGEERSVRVHPVNSNPESGDEYMCDACGDTNPY